MNDILREIGMIARALDSISNIEFKDLDLTRGQYLYLVRIYENPGIIQEKLAEMIKVDGQRPRGPLRSWKCRDLFKNCRMSKIKK